MPNKNVYIIAGERSGDLHGGLLAEQINKMSQGKVALRGIGGEQMRKQGVHTCFDIKDMAVMMLVVSSLYKIIQIYKKTTKDILSIKPDLVVLIDYGGFNLRVARFCKKHNIPVFYYIPPKMWAWAQWRVKNLRKSIEKAFVILPFEKDFFVKHNVNVDYVGNPLIDACNQFKLNPSFKTDNNLDERPIIAVLPGSRKQELKLLLRKMLDVSHEYPDYQFVVAGIDSLPRVLYPIEAYPRVRFVFEQTYDLLSVAHAALVVSGTATLEAALFGVPQVSGYVLSWLPYQMIRIPAKRYLSNSFFSLVNLIAGKRVITELFQQRCTVSNFADALGLLVGNTDERRTMLAEYRVMKDSLGDKVPTVEVSRKILTRIGVIC